MSTQLPERSLANLTLTELLERCSYAPDRASLAAKNWNDRLRANHRRAVMAAMRDGHELRPEVKVTYIEAAQPQTRE